MKKIRQLISQESPKKKDREGNVSNRRRRSMDHRDDKQQKQRDDEAKNGASVAWTQNQPRHRSRLRSPSRAVKAEEVPHTGHRLRRKSVPTRIENRVLVADHRQSPSPDFETEAPVYSQFMSNRSESTALVRITPSTGNSGKTNGNGGDLREDQEIAAQYLEARAIRGHGPIVNNIQYDPQTIITSEFSRGTEFEVAGLPLQGLRNEDLNPTDEDKDSTESIALEKIYRCLQHSIKAMLPSVHFENEMEPPLQVEGIEKMIHSLVRECQSRDRTTQALKEVIRNGNSAFDSLQREFDEKSTELQNCNTRVSALEQEKAEALRGVIFVNGQVSVLREDQDKREERIRKIQDEQRVQSNNYISEIQQLKADIRISNSTHEKELSKMRTESEFRLSEVIQTLNANEDKFRTQKEDMDEKHQEALKFSADGFAFEKIELIGEHEATLRRVTEDLQRQMSDMEKAHQDAIREKSDEIKILRETHDRDTKRAEEELQAKFLIWKNNLEQEYHSRMQNLQSTIANHEAEKTSLETFFTNEKIKEHKKLNADIEALKAALTKRDHFKGLSDHEAAQRFQTICSEVDEFARVEWDRGLKETWMIDERVLGTWKTENERRTKQYLVQNSLWVVLWERIFASPFRVLGREGKELDKQWFENFGLGDQKSGGIPQATRDSEKWRYENITVFIEAIRGVLSPSDPKYTMKRGYEIWLNEAAEEISLELGKVASVTRSDKQRIRELVKKAADLWLEVGKQRCRMFLLMSDSDQAPLRSGRDAIHRDGSIKLTVVPELRRTGNSLGEKLERDELVTDCRGKFSVFCPG